MKLLERADNCESYSLFIIHGIRELRRKEMLLESVPSMASELRDMFMVCCDGIEPLPQTLTLTWPQSRLR